MPSAPGQAAWRESGPGPLGTLGELDPVSGNRPPHQSQFHTSQHLPLLSELRLCQALPHHPTALLEGWTDEGLETWVTKRCSAHLTSQGWGRLDFAPRGHLPSPWHVPMGPRHHLASGDQDKVSRREERVEEADSHVSGPGPGGKRPDLPPPWHTSSLAGEAVSASLLPRPCRKPRTRPASRHCNRQGRRWWGTGWGRAEAGFSAVPPDSWGEGEYQKEAAGGAHHPPPTLHSPSTATPRSSMGFEPWPLRTEGAKARQADPRGQCPGQAPEAVCAGANELSEGTLPHLLTCPGLSFLISGTGAIPKSQACLKDKWMNESLCHSMWPGQHALTRSLAHSVNIY